MKEKLKFNNIWLIPALLIAGLCSSCYEARDDHHHSGEVYYCPMDTGVVQNGTGICPVCKMDLVKKENPIKPLSKGSNPAIISVKTSAISKVKTVNPVNKSIPVSFKVTGYITYDERNFHDISARYGGRIEKLYVKYAFQKVKKGQPIFDIYSHELRSAQHNYLFVLQNDAGSKNMLEAAKQKLLLLGMTTAQIEHLMEEGHVNPTITVYSPYDGYVKEGSNEENIPVSPDKNGNDSESMNEPTNINRSNMPLQLREGTYISKGQSVFQIVNTEQVWAILEIPSNNISYIKLKQPVTIQIENSDKILTGNINFIEPSLDKNSGAMRARVYLDNSDNKLKPGNLITININIGIKNGLWVPKAAIIDLGREKIVFIKKDIVYEAHIIQTGMTSENEIEVTRGLKPEDKIAENGQLLTDSESFVKVLEK